MLKVLDRISNMTDSHTQDNSEQELEVLRLWRGDVSEQELEVLRGVGNDLCSSSWINNTLMSLCEIDKHGWTKELEDRLCTLWDLSMVGEVVPHLMSHDFLKIAKKTLVISNERLTEIILGIIANVCSSDEAIDTISRDQELVTQILSRLESDNSLILIQLIRFLQLIVSKIRENHQSNWATHLGECKFFGDSIIFILKNSTNDDLLVNTMEMLSIFSIGSLANKKFLEELFEVGHLISAMLESFMKVTSTRKTSCFEWQFAEDWLEVILAIKESNHGLTFKNYETDEGFLKLIDIIYRILEPCKQSSNLYPIREGGACMILNVIKIMSSFNEMNAPRIYRILAAVTFSLKMVSVFDSSYELDPMNKIAGLLDYLNIHWLQQMIIWTSEEIADILRLCKRDIREYLISLVQSYPKVTREMFEKMKMVAIAVENNE